jgi:hypothetical protein
VQLDINLLDPSLRPRKVLLPARIFAPALAAVALLLVTCAVLQSFEARVAAASRRDMQARAVALQTEVRSLGEQLGARRVSPEVQSLAAEREALRVAREAAVTALRTRDDVAGGGHARYLQALARQSVEGLWLTEVTVAGSGDDIALRGRTLDPELVRGLSPPARSRGRAARGGLQPAFVPATGRHRWRCRCEAALPRIRGHLGDGPRWRAAVGVGTCRRRRPCFAPCHRVTRSGCTFSRSDQPRRRHHEGALEPPGSSPRRDGESRADTRVLRRRRRCSSSSCTSASSILPAAACASCASSSLPTRMPSMRCDRQKQALVEELRTHPDEPFLRRIEAADRGIADLDREIQALGAGLAAPERMAALVKEVLARSPQIALVAMRNLPPTPVDRAAGGRA